LQGSLLCSSWLWADGVERAGATAMLLDERAGARGVHAHALHPRTRRMNELVRLGRITRRCCLEKGFEDEDSR
jgi:hypothetical protein